MRLRMVVILLLLSAPASVSNAQPPADSTIRLAHRSFVPRRGIDSGLISTVRASRVPVHALVQLTRPLTDRDRVALAGVADWRIVHTTSPTLHVVSIPAGPMRQGLPDGVRWMGLIPSRDKVALGVGRGPAPRAGSRRAEAPLVIMFHSDIREADQLLALRRHAANRIQRVTLINAWTIDLHPDSVAGLAAEDAVSWIEPAPRLGRGDNDIARSATGINADAVLAPSLYGLSGAGMTLAYWDNSIPFRHLDFETNRVTNADGSIGWYTRNVMHAENAPANGKLDLGEVLYIDIDDSQSITPLVDYKAGTTQFALVPAGATGDALVFFNDNEKFVDANGNGIYDFGEGIYDDADANWKVTPGEMLLAGNGALDGADLALMPKDPHGHSTMVIGSILGSGTNSEAGTGASLPAAGALQWKGVAPSASVSARTVCKPSPTTGQFLCFISPTAAARASWFQTFSAEHESAMSLPGLAGYVHPWGPGGCDEFYLPATCYLSPSYEMDLLANNHDADGNPKGLARRVLAIASSGNSGYPERHTEAAAEDGRFQAAEEIYLDTDGNGVVDNSVDVLLSATRAPDGVKLVDFRPDERHVTTADHPSGFSASLGIYRDADGSGSVTASDERLLVPGMAAGPVGAADPDVSQPLKRFALWGSVQIYMAAKNTLQVGAVPSDMMRVPAFSSRGPTHDGRMKPDLVAPGTQVAGTGGVTSTYVRNGYATGIGTSMSTGIAGGAVALLTEWYRKACDLTGYPPPELTRALLVHGADDVVDPTFWAGAGPDYASGFGRMRVKDAVDLVQHHYGGSLASAASVHTTTITIPRTAPLKVTLAWSDPPWHPAYGPGPHGILNNDLDLLLIAPDGRRYGPWILDPKQPEVAAVRASYASGVTPTARDARNTVEQVVVDDAAPGTWTIQVTASQLNFSPQAFVVVSEAVGPSQSPCATAPAADVWVRDNDTDTGATPSGGFMWLGPDLWNRNAPDGAADHQNPEYGEQNYLYATVRNRGATQAASTTVELWLGDAATGLIWPSSYTYVGRVVVPNLAPGETRQVGPVAWTPPGPGHYCMYMRLLSAQDPIAAAEGASITANASNNNNIAYRNLNVVDLHSARTVSFLVRNVAADETLVDVALRVPAAFLQSGTVDINLSPGLRAAWTGSQRPTPGLAASPRAGIVATTPNGAPRTLPAFAVETPEVVLTGFRLKRGQAERVTITFASSRRDTATFNVDVEQRAAGQGVGGIRYVVRTGRR